MASGRMSVVGMALLGVLAARGTHTADPAVDVDVIVPAERNGVQWELLDSAGGTAAVDLPNVVGFGHSDKDLVFVTSGPDANAVSTFDRHSFKAEAQVTLQQVSPASADGRTDGYSRSRRWSGLFPGHTDRIRP